MSRHILRLVPAAAMAALLAGCTGWAPPPLAQIECEQQEPRAAGADYLNCVAGWQRQNPPAQNAATTPAAAPNHG
jgi:outer membrane PBP1 activator LpoA protein